MVMEFKDWLNGKFTEWEQTQPRRQSYSAFSRYLGIRQTTFSQWINGNGIPSFEKAMIISGNEVYPLLGFATPGESDPFANLPPELRSAIAETNRRIASLGSPADLSTSLKILAEEIKPFELMLTSKTDKDGLTK
jgi:transcriptional regulator with XRE-family HTH domain